MPQDAERLIWIDMEMTGLKPDNDRIIEVALVVTDNNLATVAEGPVLVVHQDDAVLAAMDSWNQSTHGRTGLTEKVRGSTLDEAEAERRLLAFLREHVPSRVSPMCGNTICQDRRFLANYMPQLEAMGDTAQLVFAMYFHALGLAGRNEFSACEAKFVK